VARVTKNTAAFGDTTPLHERVARLIDAVGGTGEAAKLVDWRKEGASLPLQKILTLAVKAGVSLDWVATGHDVRPDIQSSIDAAGFAEDDGFAFLPLYQARAGAGQGLVPVDEQVVERLAFRRDWLRRTGINPENTGLLLSFGDSMYPTIPDGAVMMVDFAMTDRRDGCIYVLAHDDTVMVKRLQLRADGSIVMISDNPLYERQTVTREEFDGLRIVGRVVWVGHTL